jgi:Tfp pilus assembly protein PilF
VLADGYASRGDMPAARRAYEQLLKQAPNDAEALNNYAHVLLRLKDVAGAQRAASLALAARPNAPHVLGTAGWMAYQAGQPDRALQLLRDARLRDPANAETRYYLASVLASTGRAAEARDELQAALRAGSSFASAREAQALLDTLR